MIFINQIKPQNLLRLKKWALAFCREGESWIRLNKWRKYFIFDVFPVWRINKIKGFVRQKDWEESVTLKTLGLENKCATAGAEIKPAWSRFTPRAWCKIGDTLSLILIASACARSEPEPNIGFEEWHGTALVCKRRAIKISQIEVEAPVALRFCSSSTLPLGDKAKIPKTKIKTKVFRQSCWECLRRVRTDGKKRLLMWLTCT